MGPYEVVAPLGAGGMGEVYRARDPRLGREVAIKALPEAFARDPERLARFEREAKLLASLSHPAIAGIHGLEEQGGERYLILEFVDGETLGDRLRRGALPVDDALEVCGHIAAALEAAHESGIVHRDLKPGNVMITTTGAVKVLDFGLAKGASPLGGSSEVGMSASPTMTYAATAAGVILGTAAYMSPEQARGKSVDRRTDIWSFGCVLYECLTAKPLFSGETISDLVAQILKSEPDLSALPAETPAHVRRLLERCLRKDPRDRLRDMGDARLELSEGGASLGATGGAGAAAVATPRTGLLVALALASLLIGAVGMWTWATMRGAPAESPIREASIMLPPDQRFVVKGGNGFLAMSPDGRAVVFAARTRGSLCLHVRHLDTREDIQLPGTDDARDPFFSPDGEWVGFFDSHQLMKVSVRGGEPVALAGSTADRGAVWLDDDTIVFAADAVQALSRMSAAGGKVTAFTTLDSTKQERTHRWPAAIAEGPWVLFTVGAKNSPGNYDGADIDAVNAKSGERRTLVHGARRAIWVAPDHLVFDRKGTLFAVKIDPRNPRVTGEPVPVLEGIAGNASSGATYFGSSRDGSLAWIPSRGEETQREVGWYDRAGAWTPTKFSPGECRMVDVSPDGKSALLLIGAGGGAGDLWLCDLDSGNVRRLTYSDRLNSFAWMPDGQSFVYSLVDSAGHSLLAMRRLDSAGGTRIVSRVNGNGLVVDVVRSGAEVIVADWGAADGRMYNISCGDSVRIRMIATDLGHNAYETAGRLSPDGQWMAYITNRTGREEVFVRRTDGASGQWQVSTHGAGGVRWGRDGTEIFFVEDEMLKSVRLLPRGNDLGVGAVTTLFEVPASPVEPTLRDFDYDPRSDRFLFTRPPAGTDERREIALSIGWGRRLSQPRTAKGAKP